MIEDFEWAFRFWNLISNGSLQMKITQNHELFSIHATKDTVIIDFHSPEAMDFLGPFIQKNLAPKEQAKGPPKERHSIILGLVHSFVAKKTELSKYMSMSQDLATVFYKHKKCLILQENGKQLAKIGYGADSLGMRLLNLEHIEVNDLSALMRLLERAKI